MVYKHARYRFQWPVRINVRGRNAYNGQGLHCTSLGCLRRLQLGHDHLVVLLSLPDQHMVLPKACNHGLKAPAHLRDVLLPLAWGQHLVKHCGMLDLITL